MTFEVEWSFELSSHPLLITIAYLSSGRLVQKAHKAKVI